MFKKTTIMLFIVMLSCVLSSDLYSNDGILLGHIREIKNSSQEIIVVTTTPPSLGEKLYVRIDGELTMMTATYPMMSIVKCKLDPVYSGRLTKLKEHMSVYVYNDNVDRMSPESKVITNFHDNSDDTITDTSTGLMWTKNANISGSEMNLEEAKTFIEALHLAGHSDWRLPSEKELVSLVKKNSDETGKDGDASEWLLKMGFQNVVSDLYWSSTRSRFDSWSNYNVVSMETGVVGLAGKTTRNYIWPVRNGK